MRKFLSALILCSFFMGTSVANACESCMCSLSRSGDAVIRDKNWFFDLTVEGIDWDSRAAGDAHALHHEGHHAHNKTHEEFYHFNLGWDIKDNWSILTHVPYVARHLSEIDSHRFLGQKQTSEGLGDLNVDLVHRFWRDHEDFLGALAGVKFPTGSTTEKNPQGVRYETEMQPGSGSVDSRLGGRFFIRPPAVYF